jgi:proteasome accessory factor C
VTPVVATYPAGSSDVASRLRRLLAVLEYLAAVGESTIEELAGRFEMSHEEVVAELELAACCGLPPYTPDELIELLVDGERVVALEVGELGRPRRLTPAEGFAVAAAARALLAVPGADPTGSLGGALAKLEAVLGHDRLVLDIDAPEHLAALRSAHAGGRQVEITYAGAGTASGGAPTVRRVDPYQVVLREGRWYLDGWCHRAGGVRRFQVGRVLAVRETGEAAAPPAERPAALDEPRAFLGGPDAFPAVVAAPPAAGWLLERVASGAVSRRDDGRVEAMVLVGSERWLERLILRLGPSAEVVDPPALAGVARAGALRALARYEAEMT